MPMFESSPRPAKIHSSVKHLRKSKIRKDGRVWLILDREWDRRQKEWIYTVAGV